MINNKELYTKEIGNQEDGPGLCVITFSRGPSFSIFSMGHEYSGDEAALDELISSLQEAKAAMQNAP